MRDVAVPLTRKGSLRLEDTYGMHATMPLEPTDGPGSATDPVRAMKSQARSAAIGALAFVAIQFLLPPTYGGYRWFLNSEFTVAMTLGALAVVAIVVEVLDRSSTLWRPVCLAAGTSLAFVGYLFAVGPGNLFPIVIVTGLAMLIPTVLIAGCIGIVVAIIVRGG